MKKLICLCIVSAMLFQNIIAIEGIAARSAILMTEDGEVLWEKNADERLEPASVTKIMTMLLVSEAIEKGKISRADMVTASTYASSIGGSQIWLKEGEQMSVDDLFKSLAVVSANDSAVALAEYVAGTAENFVKIDRKSVV